MNRYRPETEHTYPHHADEHAKGDRDAGEYDYRSFRIDLSDVIWAWIFSAIVIVSWLFAFL